MDPRRHGVIVVRETCARFTEGLHRLTLEPGPPGFAAVVAVAGVPAAPGGRHACRN